MAVTVTAGNYPAFVASAGKDGKRIALHVNYGTNASATSPVWTLVGGVTNSALNFSGNVSTVQTKDSGYWQEGVMTGKSVELTAEVIFKADNTAQEVIEQFLLDDDISSAKNALQFAMVDLDTDDYYKFTAIPTAWNIVANTGDFVTKSLTCTIVGKPEKLTPFTPPSPPEEG